VCDQLNLAHKTKTNAKTQHVLLTQYSAVNVFVDV